MTRCTRVVWLVAFAALACDRSSAPDPLLSNRNGGPAASTGPAARRTPTYQERRAAFRVNLKRSGPSPQSWQPQTPPENVREVEYPSEDLMLKAWVYVPPGAENRKSPAMVYFHGGFAFASEDYRDSAPFREAGYVVMCPMLRGENGNPGRFEMLMGEVDDAKAAIEWLHDQPYVDPDRIHAFGHSAGGGISALLSLHDDVPVRLTGSSGGLYHASMFRRWGDNVPFDANDPEECLLRVLMGNIRDMRRRHCAYMGREDGAEVLFAAARKEDSQSRGLLSLVVVPGDHHSSLLPSMKAFMEAIREYSVQHFEPPPEPDPPSRKK